MTIKINENKVLGMLQSFDYEGLKLYIETETHNQTVVEKSSDKKRIKAIQSFMKKCHKLNKEVRPSIAGGFIQDDKLCATNSFMAVRFNDTAIPCQMIDTELEQINLSPIFQFNNKRESIKIDILELMQNEKSYKGNIAGLKGKDKDRTTENKGITVINTPFGEMGFNNEYLIDANKMLDFENCKLTVSGTLQPLYIVNNNDIGDGLVLPVRLDK